MSEQLSFQPPAPTEDKPELNEEEQKALDLVNAQREKEEQAGTPLLQFPPLFESSHFDCTPTALPYRWHQTLNELTVSIPVPAGSKSRDLIVEIKKKALKVALKGKGPEGVIIDGELPKEIKVDDSTWTLGACFRECSTGDLPSRSPRLLRDL
jgi:hypothetical protein